MNPDHDKEHWDMRLLGKLSNFYANIRRKPRSDQEELISQDYDGE